MNREIKFRGLRTDGKGWVYGGISIFNGDADIYDSSCVVNSAYEVIPESVGQYTGLKDCKGVEIYEGDWLAMAGYSCYVSFEHGGFVTVYEHPEDGETLMISDLDLEQMSVVGDIHEHKHLLL